MAIDELGYVEEMRQRLGLDENDTSRDEYIEQMDPFDRVRLIVGWEFGSAGWANTFKDYCESQGIYLTTNPDADGII